VGASSSANTGTLDLNAGGNYVANSYGTALAGGFNMNFTNSSGSAATLRFTNAENYVTIATSTSAGRSLNNQSSSLDITFDGNIEIGSATLSDKAIEFAGPGNFLVNGAVKNSGGAVRGLLKTGAGTLTLAGSGNNYDGTTAVDGGTLLLTNSATLTGSTALTVSTNGTVSSSSATRTAAATLNVESGSTLLSNSITTVYSGGNLIVNGTAGSVVIETNGLVGGSGTVGLVNLKSGAVLNPGNSPGLLTALSATWAAGSTYNWEINDADGTAGTNWDLFSVTEALNLSDLNSNRKMNLVLNSLSLANFSTSSPDSWVIAQAGSFTGTDLAVGADLTSWFNINATAFNNGVGPNGGFKVEVGSSGDLKTLNLMAIPEPSTASMLGLGLGGLVVTRLLRRKSS
jgi:autotransporter-associated beta strand protein